MMLDNNEVSMQSLCYCSREKFYQVKSSFFVLEESKMCFIKKRISEGKDLVFFTTMYPVPKAR